MKIRNNLTKIIYPLISLILLSNNQTNAQSLEKPLSEEESKIKDEIILVKTGRYTEAIFKLKNKSIDFPDNPSIFYYLGKAYEKQDNLIESFKNYNLATEVDPNYAKPFMAIALLKGKQNKLNETVEFLDKALSIDPNYAKAYSNRGVAKGALSDNKGAIADFTSAIKLDPLMSEAYVNRGITHELMGNIQLACSDWKSAKSLGNSKVNPWFNKQCKNIPLEEITISAINTDLMKEIKTLKKLIENQEKTLNQVINSKPTSSDASTLREIQIGNIPDVKVSNDISNQEILVNELSSTDKARLKLNSILPNVKDQTENNNELNESLSVGVIKEEEKSPLITQNNPANNIKIRPAAVSETINSTDFVNTKEQNLALDSATLPIISSSPIQKRQIALNQESQGANSLIMSTVSASTLRKDEIVADNYINNEKTTNLDSNSLTVNQLNSIIPDSNSFESINTFQESQNTLPLSNEKINSSNLDKTYSQLDLNQFLSNDLKSNASTFSLGFFMATTSLLLIDKLRGQNNVYQKKEKLNLRNNIYPKMVNESLSSNQDIDLDLKETTQIIEQTQLLVKDLDEQKFLIEKEIKKLTLDLDFLKIKQSNLKVYCLSKYRNEIDNNNEYKLSSKFALNNESKGTIKFNSGDFSI